MESLSPLIRRRLKFVPGTLRALAVLSGLILLLSGCGGGPIVATSTGRILYVATTSGIYGFVIMSDGALNPVSSQPLDSGSYSQIAATSEPPTGQTSPLLLGASSATASSLTVWTIGGTGPLTKTTSLSHSGCTAPAYSGNITGVAVTSDNLYALVVDGTTAAGAGVYNTATLALSGGGCKASAMTNTTGAYPVQPSLDCQVPLSSSCILFLTLSTAPTTTTISATTSEEDTFTETTGALGTPTYAPYSTCPCPSGVTFNANTLYFYTSFDGSSPSLQSIGPKSTASTSTVAFSTPSLNLPCMDSIGGTAYIPSSNGYLYSVGVGSGGSLGSITTLVTPSTFGTTLYMNSCAVVTNP